MKALHLLLVLLLCGLTVCCTKQPRSNSTTDSTTAKPAAPGEQPASSDELLQAAGADLKQLIIMYTGDTLSAVLPPEGYEPPQGGIPALANAVAEYQRSIVYFNQLRISDAGGDPSTIKADRAAGLLGQHPFLLVDYGGWERANDGAGAPLVELFLTYVTDFGYNAVGSTLYARLAAERWDAYNAVNPGAELLVSAGTAQGDPLPSVRTVTRGVHGSLWCIVAVPLPRVEDGDPFKLIQQYVDEARAQVDSAGAEYSILLLAEGPSGLYRDLAEDGRFTVVIGAPAKVAAAPGWGDITPGATLILPELNPSGRQLGVCHLQYDGERPARYHLLLNDCLEDESKPYPYRDQAAQAWDDHEQLARELLSTAKIGNP